MIKRYFKNIRGETLAETIIALCVLAIGITVASSSILNSIRNMATAKNRVLAVNIAREGIEAMHNIRDTNWLLYSDRRRECWNHDPTITPCEGTTPIPPGQYIVYRSVDHHWKIVLADSDSALDTNGDGDALNDLDLTPISMVDLDLTVDGDGNGIIDNDADIYNHTSLEDAYGPETSKTPFKRYITIEYLDTDGTFENVSQLETPFDSISSITEWKTMGNDADKLNRMRVTSTVEWTQGSATHKTELKTILTDHLGRVELES